MKPRDPVRPTAADAEEVRASAVDANVLERISDAIVAVDRDWVFTYVNSRGAALLGRGAADLPGRHMWTEFPKGVGRTFHRAGERALATGEPAFIEEYYAPVVGWFEYRIHPSAHGLVIYFHEITARKQSEEAAKQARAALEASEARLRLALRAANQGWYDLDLRTGAAEVSPEYAVLLGYDPREFVETNRRWFDRLHPEDRERVGAVFEDYLAGRRSEYRVEFRQRAASGDWRWLLSVGSIVERTPDGAPARMLGTHTDITAFKESQLDLARLKRTLDHLTDGVWVFAADDLRVLYANAAAAAPTGRSVEEVSSMTLPEVVPFLGDAAFRERLDALRRGEVRQLTVAPREPPADGAALLEVTVDFVDDATGPPRFVAIARDVAERQRAAETLRRSEEDLRITLQSIGDAVIATDADGRVTRMNPTAERLTGWTVADAVGRPLAEVFRIVDAATRESIVDPVQLVLARGEVVELANHTALLARDGQQFQIADSAAPIRAPDGTIRGVVLVFSDVTEQYLTQLALRDRERRLHAIIETEPECVKVVGADGRLQEMNAAGLAMLEATSVDEVRAHSLTEFIVPEYRQAFVELHRSVMAGDTGTLEFEVVGLRGTRRWLETHAAPMLAEGGEGRVLLGVTRDVTLRREAERSRDQLASRVRQMETLDALGRLAGGVAHDFNNLLSVINGTAELALEALSPDEPLAADLREIRQAGERAAALTNQLLAFSRTEMVTPSVLDLNVVLAGMQPLLSRVIREDIELAVLPDREPCLVSADPGQIERVVMNLVLNARDAIGGAGRIAIETHRVATPRAQLGVPDGPYVAVVVRDSGRGMDSETRDRLFEPFYTTKARGRGTGLGLATVYGIVTQAGGGIDVVSRPTMGTTLTVYLPRVAPEAASPERPAPTAPRQGGTETILVVDDEPSLVRVVTRVLRSAGYQTLAAESGDDALRVLQAHDGPVHLLLTDVVMPRMRGPELAARVCALRPETRVLYASGYADDEILREAVQDRTALLIAKPYSPETLRVRVRDALDRPPGGDRSASFRK